MASPSLEITRVCSIPPASSISFAPGPIPRRDLPPDKLSRVAAAMAISGRLLLYGFTIPGPTMILDVDLAIAPQATQALSHRRSCAITPSETRVSRSLSLDRRVEGEIR